MLENKNYYASVYLLYKYKYLEYFLNCDEFCKNYGLNIDNTLLINSSMNLILIKSYVDKNNKNLNSIGEENSTNKLNLKLVNYSCLLLPYKKFEIPEGKNKSTILSKIIGSKRFFLPKSEINEIILNIEGETEFINLMQKPKQEIYDRYIISQFLIKYKFKNLPNIIILSICEEYLNLTWKNNEIIETIDEIMMKSILDKYNEIINYIKKEKLENIEKMKPLLDGKEIMKILNIKDGKKIKNYINLIMKEQINNPNITKEEILKLIEIQK